MSELVAPSFSPSTDWKPNRKVNFM